MFGRRMTVALGPKGSNFILGGKISQVSAEDAYRVSFCLMTDYRSNRYAAAPHHTGLWQRSDLRRPEPRLHGTEEVY